MDTPKNNSVAKPENNKQASEGLNSLKSAGRANAENPVKTNTLASKMPSRTANKEEATHKNISIPVPKRYTGGSVITSSSVHNQPLTYEPEKIKTAQKTFQEKRISIGTAFGGKETVANSSRDALKARAEAPKQDASIFGGKTEITRRDMAYQLKQGKQEYVTAQRGLSLNLSRQQRADLVAKYFPKTYGSSISKTEFNKQIRLLEKKPILNPSERLQTQREIKFLKGIGGIK